MYQRKTLDVWIIQQYTSAGWEDVDAVLNWREALTRVKEYRQNQPELPVRSIVKRVKKEE